MRCSDISSLSNQNVVDGWCWGRLTWNGGREKSIPEKNRRTQNNVED